MAWIFFTEGTAMLRRLEQAASPAIVHAEYLEAATGAAFGIASRSTGDESGELEIWYVDPNGRSENLSGLVPPSMRRYESLADPDEAPDAWGAKFALVQAAVSSWATPVIYSGEWVRYHPGGPLGESGSRDALY